MAWHELNILNLSWGKHLDISSFEWIDSETVLGHSPEDETTSWGNPNRILNSRQSNLVVDVCLTGLPSECIQDSQREFAVNIVFIILEYTSNFLYWEPLRLGC